MDRSTASSLGALVPPGSGRVVVADLPGWPASPTDLFDLLRRRVTRDVLVGIASADPFDGDAHLAALLRIHQSGRLPRRLSFVPGEALRLTRWPVDGADQLCRAWACTLLCLAPGDFSDRPIDVLPSLVDSCLALGGDVPEPAGRLLAWLAISADADEVEALAAAGGRARRPEPVAQLALLLLGCATLPGDDRLALLADTLLETLSEPELVASLFESVSAPLWRDLVDRLLVPPGAGTPSIARLATLLTEGHSAA